MREFIKGFLATLAILIGVVIPVIVGTQPQHTIENWPMILVGFLIISVLGGLDWACGSY